MFLSFSVIYKQKAMLCEASTSNISRFWMFIYIAASVCNQHRTPNNIEWGMDTQILYCSTFMKRGSISSDNNQY